MVSQRGCRDSYGLMDCHRAVREAPCQRLFANTRHTNVRVHVTELLCVCLGGSEIYGANVAISSEAGRRFATIARLCFLFGLDPVIFPCNGCEETAEIGFLWWNKRCRGVILGEKKLKNALCFSDQHKVVLHLMEPHSFAPAGDPTTTTKRAQWHSSAPRFFTSLPVLPFPICVSPSIGFITSSLSRWCLSSWGV